MLVGDTSSPINTLSDPVVKALPQVPVPRIMFLCPVMLVGLVLPRTTVSVG